MEKTKEKDKINKNRRNFLIFLLIGSGVFLLRKIFGPGLLKFFSPLFLPQAKALAATTYYLDAVNGNDNNPGTTGLPWRTIAFAKKHVAAGDTVYLTSGDYGKIVFGESGDSYGTSWNAPIIYQRNPNSPAHSVKFRSLTFQGATYLYLIVDGIDVEVDTATFGSCAYGVYFDCCSYVKIVNCEVHGLTHQVGPSDAIIFGNGANNLVIENCSAHDSGGADRKPHGIEFWTSYYVTVKNCSIYNFVSSGLRTGGGDHYIFENVRVFGRHDEWYDPYNPGQESHGSGISLHSKDTTVRGCYVSLNAFPIRTYQSVFPNEGYVNMLIENNHVGTCTGVYGLIPTNFIDVGENFIIRNNTFTTGCQINMCQDFWDSNDCSGLKLYNNVFIKGVALNSPYPGGDSHTLWSTVSESKNIALSVDDGLWHFFDNFSPSSNSIVIKGANGQYKSGYDNTYFNAGKFFTSIDPNSESSFRLEPNSPAIDFADPAYASLTDKLGNNRVGLPDAGCYEYGASTFLYGDVNNDKEITAYDAALTAQAAVGLITLTADQTKAADVSGNREVSAHDAALIAQKAVGLIEKFPVEQ